MKNSGNPLVLVDRDGGAIVGKWCLDGEAMIWTIDGNEFRIRSSGDLSAQVRAFLRPLGKTLDREGLSIKSCLSCAQFRMSNMARDMGRGQRGACMLHKRGVEICFLCDDYERAGTNCRPNAP